MSEQNEKEISKCDCQERSCTKDCNRKHTCHTYWCEKYKPTIPQSLEDKVGDSIRKEILENGFNLHYVREEEKLREEFAEYLRDNWEDRENFIGWWLKKIAEREAEYREKMIEAISEDITNYDEVYISEDVRKAINRMKYSLKTLIKNK